MRRNAYWVHGHDDKVEHPMGLVEDDCNVKHQFPSLIRYHGDSRAPESVNDTIVAKRPATATGDIKDLSVWKGLMPIVPLPI